MSVLKNISFQLDMINQGIENIGTLVQDDTGANILKISLRKGDKPYDLTDAIDVNAQIKDEFIFLTTVPCDIEDAANGIISFVLPDVTIDEKMTCTGEIQVEIDSARLTSSMFEYEVREELANYAYPSNYKHIYPIVIFYLGDTPPPNPEEVDVWIDTSKEIL